MSKALLRALPSIERLLASPVAIGLSETLSRDRVRDLLRQLLDELREEVISGQSPVTTGQIETDNGELASKLQSEIESRLGVKAAGLVKPSLRRVINATGVIIHTNLGRAPLAHDAIAAIADVASHYSNLEYDLYEGKRGKREAHCAELLARLVGSQDATCANNCAAAVLLVLNTLAEGGEVIVSRGELIEIGGSFRIPEVMEKSGAKLREVGTTNRTRISDYANAITENTRLILRVHPSNYRIIGFTERPTLEEIVELSRRAHLPTFEDLGSGCLLDLAPYGVRDEPVVSASLKAGIAVVAFSGDKMLGGPQAGIIAGAKEMVERVRKNPLMRALRVDKLTYAALEATLRIYERGAAKRDVPVIRAMAIGASEVETRAENFKDRLLEATQGGLKIALEGGVSVIGGGSAPEVQLPTVLVAIEAEALSATVIENQLRNHAVPIIARTERNRVLLDLRTVADDEEEIIIKSLMAIAQLSQPSAASVEA